MDQSQQQDFSEAQGEREAGVTYCSFNPGVETALGCGRCGKFICPKCMIQTSVGARCPECARVTKHPTFDVTPSYYLRAAMVGGTLGIVGGVIWGLLSLVTPFSGILAIGMGYLMGEAVSVASNRKRGTGLAVIAGGGMALAILASGLASSFYLSNPFWLVMVAVAVYTAVQRVR